MTDDDLVARFLAARGATKCPTRQARGTPAAEAAKRARAEAAWAKARAAGMDWDEFMASRSRLQDDR